MDYEIINEIYYNWLDSDSYMNSAEYKESCDCQHMMDKLTEMYAPNDVCIKISDYVGEIAAINCHTGFFAGFTMAAKLMNELRALKGCDVSV